jgi:hypothetical protein
LYTAQPVPGSVSRVFFRPPTRIPLHVTETADGIGSNC